MHVINFLNAMNFRVFYVTYGNDKGINRESVCEFCFRNGIEVLEVTSENYRAKFRRRPGPLGHSLGSAF